MWPVKLSQIKRSSSLSVNCEYGSSLRFAETVGIGNISDLHICER